MTAMICLAFMRLAKYKIFAVLVRNVGYKVAILGF